MVIGTCKQGRAGQDRDVDGMSFGEGTQFSEAVTYLIFGTGGLTLLAETQSPLPSALGGTSAYLCGGKQASYVYGGITNSHVAPSTYLYFSKADTVK